jgi:hypothetical protein
MFVMVGDVANKALKKSGVVGWLSGSVPAA